MNNILITYDNFNEINKQLQLVYIALNEEGCMGIYNKKSNKYVSMLPFEGRYNLNELEYEGMNNYNKAANQ